MNQYLLLSDKRKDFFIYAVSIIICAASYYVFNKNIALSLLPHKTVMEYLFNYNFVFIENVGYEQTSGLFTITRNCMGSKLFISLFFIMVFGFLHRYAGMKRKITAVVKFYSIALASAFVATVIRISASVPFCAWDRFHLIHNIISLTVYFMSGLVLYFVMERKTYLFTTQP